MDERMGGWMDRWMERWYEMVWYNKLLFKQGKNCNKLIYNFMKCVFSNSRVYAIYNDLY